MKITEPQMFRVVLVVGIAMIPVILLAALVDPLAGAILFGLELGMAIGYLYQRVRAVRARRAVPSPNSTEGEPVAATPDESAR